MRTASSLGWNLLCLSLILGFVRNLPAAEEPGNELVQMITNLVTDKDKDLRAVGLQQIREEAKGEKATEKFAALLPKLAPEMQAGLIDALGDRGDKAARPAIVDMLKSRDEQVRASAIKALGLLGERADVPVLAQFLAAAGAEKAAARTGLANLRGKEVNAAVRAEIMTAKSAVRAELLGVLAARRATETIPAVLEAAEDSNADVRAAAFGALRLLAGQAQTAALVKLLKAAKESQEQWKAELALLAVCTRGKEACVEPILAGMKDAEAPAAAALLRALARCGGAKSLSAIVAATKDQRVVVRAEAVRVLASWPEVAAVPHLRIIAAQAEPTAQQGAAVEGMVRLASPVKDRPANMALLAEAMKLARRPQEKRLILGVLGGLPATESLALVQPALDDPVVADDAALAAVLIAENTVGTAPAQRRAALEKARDKAKDPEIRQRAEKALEGIK